MVEEIPSCPTNIVKMTKSLAPTFKKGVKPEDKPVVPKAEETSKKTSAKLNCSIGALPHIVSIEVKAATVVIPTMSKEIIKTRKAEITVSFGILRLKILMSLRPRNLLQTANKIIAKVVVLIPPAVDEGALPINIITEKVIKVVSVKACKWVVENPAFRVEKE